MIVEPITEDDLRAILKAQRIPPDDPIGHDGEEPLTNVRWLTDLLRRLRHLYVAALG